MDLQYKDNNLIVTGLKDFNLSHIFDCGQCFRFNAIDENTYFGIAKSKALKISQNGDTVTLYDTTEEDFRNIWFDYFDLARNYGEIKKKLSNDAVMQEAISYGEGIRILRQDLWETVISFIISSSNNIPRIKGIIERFCEQYGREIRYMGNTYYSFPDIETTASLSREDLSVIRAGYRDKYILDAAKKFFTGELSDKYIRQLSRADAKKALMTINGVGNKVSDCILLFGLGHADSFPVDVWIKRIMEYCYFNEEQSIETISRFADERFGDMGGFAQQYLFFYARENKIGIA
ncbi:MAG: DNA-3-methyladenine glycosylase 2 family protein [Oscillospiraceae bacterium]|nr:DNA-3-methyladenine glycosylase 2 family protein [Oscillospiraceae bacterium]